MVLGGESSQDVHQLGKHGMVETYVTLIALIVRDNLITNFGMVISCIPYPA